MILVSRILLAAGVIFLVLALIAFVVADFKEQIDPVVALIVAIICLVVGYFLTPGGFRRGGPTI